MENGFKFCTEKIVRKKLLFEVSDRGSGLLLAFYKTERGILSPTLTNSLILTENKDIQFFAGQLLDPSVLDPTGKVELKEPYPYIIRVRWDNMHRIVSFVSYEDGATVESIRLSPLEAYRVGQLSQNTALINHLLERLKKYYASVNKE